MVAPFFCFLRRCWHIFLDGFPLCPRERRLGRHRTPRMNEPTSLSIDLAPRPVHATLLAPCCLLTTNRRTGGTPGGHRDQNDRSRYALHQHSSIFPLPG